MDSCKENLVLGNFAKKLGLGQTPAPLVGPKDQLFPFFNFEGSRKVIGPLSPKSVNSSPSLPFGNAYAAYMHVQKMQKMYNLHNMQNVKNMHNMQRCQSDF